MSGLETNYSQEKGPGADKTASVPAASAWLTVSERCLALAMTLMTVFLHVVFLSKAGGFWRDEVNSIALAARPSFPALWSAMKFDSVPALHFLAIRGWTSVWGASDASLRPLGFTIGLAIIAALWLKSREFGDRAPFLSLLLLGMSPVMIRSLDSIRPNGLAALASILAFTAVWRAVQKPDVARLSVATLTLVLCVQILFQSAIFVLAIGLAAVSVGFLRGGFRRASLLAVPFIAAAFSLVPYAGQLQEAAKWSPVAMAPVGTKLLLPGLLEALRSPAPWFAWVWVVMGICVIGGVMRGLVRSGGREGANQGQFERSLYCGVTLLASMAGFTVFLVRLVGFSPQIWHYVPLLVVFVISAEPLVEQALHTKLARIASQFVIAGIAVAALFPAAENLTLRMTSMDLVASAIERQARADDLVIVHPWFNGVSFSRYYRGQAPWLTFPSLPETALHRYDLLKERMQHPETISADVSRIYATLQQGGRVWVVGDVYGVAPGLDVSPLPPAPLPRTGWSNVPYGINWSQQLMAGLQAHSRLAKLVPVRAEQRISPLESPQVAVFQGWRP